MTFPRLQSLLEGTVSQKPSKDISKDGKWKVGDLVTPEQGGVAKIKKFVFGREWAVAVELDENGNEIGQEFDIHQGNIVSATEGEDLYD